MVHIKPVSELTPFYGLCQVTYRSIIQARFLFPSQLSDCKHSPDKKKRRVAVASLFIMAY
jgi:hypothetical protein